MHAKRIENNEPIQGFIVFVEIFIRKLSRLKT